MTKIAEIKHEGTGISLLNRYLMNRIVIRGGTATLDL